MEPPDTILNPAVKLLMHLELVLGMFSFLAPSSKRYPNIWFDDELA
jgi:hypothetical protein